MRGSGWTIELIQRLDLRITSMSGIKGGNHLDLNQNRDIIKGDQKKCLGPKFENGLLTRTVCPSRLSFSQLSVLRGTPNWEKDGFLGQMILVQRLLSNFGQGHFFDHPFKVLGGLQKKGIRSIRDSTNMCLLNSVAAVVYDEEIRQEHGLNYSQVIRKGETYHKYHSRIKTEGVTFPSDETDIYLLAKQNPNYRITVYMQVSHILFLNKVSKN